MFKRNHFEKEIQPTLLNLLLTQDGSVIVESMCEI